MSLNKPSAKVMRWISTFQLTVRAATREHRNKHL